MGNFGKASKIPQERRSERTIREWTQEERTDRKQVQKAEAVRLTEAGWSQREIAEHLGVTHRTIGNWLGNLSGAAKITQRPLDRPSGVVSEKKQAGTRGGGSVTDDPAKTVSRWLGHFREPAKMTQKRVSVTTDPAWQAQADPLIERYEAGEMTQVEVIDTLKGRGLRASNGTITRRREALRTQLSSWRTLRQLETQSPEAVPESAFEPETAAETCPTCGRPY